MSSSAKAEAVLALHRFGWGRAGIDRGDRGRSARRVDRRTRTAVRQPRSRRPRCRRVPRPTARSTDANARRQAKANVATRAGSEAAADGGRARHDGGAAQDDRRDGGKRWPPKPSPIPGGKIYLEEARVRIEAALGAEIGFVERLVWFWSNHFCVSADKIQSMSGAYEREAIRPHVLGRFTDMLLAAEGHPAMLFYLDNLASMGAEFDRRHQPHPRPQRKSRPRDSGAAYAGRAQRLQPG